MIIKDLDLSSLSRDEYINVISIILNSFLLDYQYFTKDELYIINNIVSFYPKEANSNDS